MYWKIATSSGVLHASEWKECYSVALWPVVWLPSALFMTIFFSFFLAMPYLQFSKFLKMNIRTVNSSCWRVEKVGKKVTLVSTHYVKDEVYNWNDSKVI